MPASRRAHTDLGNAYRLVDRHGHELRYLHTWQRWLVWDGRRWRIDQTGEVNRRAIETVHTLFDEVAAAGDEMARKAAAKHALSSQERARLKAMVAVARDLAEVAVHHDQLDHDPWLLNVANGTIDLRTGRLQPHDPDDLITKLAPVVHEPTATCSTWDAFLDQILAGDADIIGYLQRLAGYALTGVIREHLLPVLVGDGSNGKTTFLSTLLALSGDYGMTARGELLLATRNDQHPTAQADLHGNRLVVVAETNQGRRLDEAEVKKLTGGDRIKARRMREDFWEFEPTHKLMLATNHLADVRGRDHGIWRRLRPIDFPVRIADDEIDTTLPDRLRGELSGILNWALAGCFDWQAGGLDTPAAVIDRADAYRAATDVLGAFLNDRCTLADGRHAFAADLYRAYRQWCDDVGDQPVSQKAFGQNLAQRGLISKKYGQDRCSAWFGIGLTGTEPTGSS